MKKRAWALLLLCAVCGWARAATVTDAFGQTLDIVAPERVVSLYGSFAETWLLAGGELVGATEDAVSQRGLALDANTQIVGSVKAPNLESILALDPDFMILAADIPAHGALDATLTALDIPHAYFRVDDYTEYLAMLDAFCRITGRDDLYEANGARVEREILDILDRVPKDAVAPKVLLLRAYSSGVRAKGADEPTGRMLEQLGADNIAARAGSTLTDLGMETILQKDPDHIFIVTMGDAESALDALSAGLMQNPAWQSLRAVKEDRVHVLPKELFHYKPNARWGESYATLAYILYPDAF